MEEEEIARNEQFLLFLQCFLLNQKIVSLFVNTFDIISLFAAEFKFKHIYFTSIEKQVLTTLLISLDSASWELHQYSRRMYGPMKNPKVETRSRDSNLGPHDCKADALPHDHGHHTFAAELEEPKIGMWGKGLILLKSCYLPMICSTHDFNKIKCVV